MEKKLSEITKKEWCLYQWLDSGTMGAVDDRVFIRGFRHTPEEAMQALEQWEIMEAVINEDESIINNQ